MGGMSDLVTISSKPNNHPITFSMVHGYMHFDEASMYIGSNTTVLLLSYFLNEIILYVVAKKQQQNRIKHKQSILKHQTNIQPFLAFPSL